MTPTTLALATLLMVTPVLAPSASTVPRAQDDRPAARTGLLLAQAEEQGPAARPESSPPAQAPPPPPAETPPAPPPPPQQTPQQQQQQSAAPGGQWVYTQQYGWLWMPYGDPYTYVPPGGYGEPQMYVYYPVVGWTWIAAPWVWGWGPWPYFGIYGPWRFAWYGHGWWRYPYRWHYRPVPYRPYYAGHVGHGFAPAPPHLHAPARGVAGHGGGHASGGGRH